MLSPQDCPDGLCHGMQFALQFIFVLQVEQYAKEPLAVVFSGVKRMNEDLLNRKLPFGQGVVVIPQTQIDPVILVGAERGRRSVLLAYAFEEHAVFIALNEQRLPGDETQKLVLLEGRYEVHKILPEDVVERVEIGLDLPGSACEAHAKKALQVVVDGIAGDASLSGQGLQALGVLDQPGEQLNPPAREDLLQGRGTMGVVEALESFCRRRPGEEDCPSHPLHQANILQTGYDPGDRALQEV